MELKNKRQRVSRYIYIIYSIIFFIQAEDGIRDGHVTGVQTCALPISATTFFGFIALSFMNFEIGADLGINLVKGIALSFISVMVFLPALTVLLYKWRSEERRVGKVNKGGE